jgi:hypothetical protein
MNTKSLQYHPERWRFLRPAKEFNAFFQDNAHAHQYLTEDAASLDLLLPWYERCGRNIFHLQPGLVELLTNSCADDMTFSHLRSPYEALYLHWSRAAGILTPDGHLHVDGAYVAFEDDGGDLNLWIYLTTEFPDIAQALSMPLPDRIRMDCRGHDFSVFFAHRNATVRESIMDKFANPYGRMSEDEYIAEQERLIEVNAENFPEFKHANNMTYAEAKAGWILPEEDVIWRESAAAAVNLIVNALCYLAYENREVDYRYPDDTPGKLVKQTHEASRKAAARAESKLAAAGFRKVHICGESLRPAQEGLSTGATRSAHWRRGHWRHQAYGTGWQQRKLVWIMPVLVGTAEARVPGHIYEVAP